MTAESFVQPSPFEQALLQVLRQLSPERRAQVLDFARWLNTQSNEELAGDEQAWETFYALNRDHYRHLAREAAAEYDAGETTELTTKDGKLSAQ